MTIEEIRTTIESWRVNPKEDDNKYIDILLEIVHCIEVLSEGQNR